MNRWLRPLAADQGAKAIKRSWLSKALIEDDTRSIFSPTMFNTIRAGTEQRLELLVALDAAGAPIMAGSDCPACALVPGASLHDELALYVEAGLSPLRALRAATLDAARFLGREKELGSLAEGELADLVVRGSDPIMHIRALRDPVGVVADGRWCTAEQLRCA